MATEEYIRAYEGLSHAVALAEGTVFEKTITAILVEADRKIVDLLVDADAGP